MQSSTLLEAIRITLTADNHDPFSVLGAHPSVCSGKTGIVVRAFIPGLASLKLCPTGRSSHRYEMNLLDEAGFYELFLPERRLPFKYRLAATFPDGRQEIFFDPYSFPPLISDFDLHLFSEGAHNHIYSRLGANFIEVEGVRGVLFGVWAPNARRVSVVGDFNAWDGRRHSMRCRGDSGVWEIFIPELEPGSLYKFELKTQPDRYFLKSDPYARYCELRPQTASRTYDLSLYRWSDDAWMKKRPQSDPLKQPLSVYEVHLASWMRGEDKRYLNYRELAERLVEYVLLMSFTHIELMPVAEHPLDDSWGYQVTSYFAPSSRFGTPDDFRYLVNLCHQNDIGVIIDWVPAHFPKDSHSLTNFDDTCLYEHADPRQGEHNDWGTMIFNYDRNEVRNFLTSNALFWFEHYHIDGIRVDAVASMLYLDYSRKEGEWIPNQYGGRENLGAISFLKSLNEQIFKYFPGVLTIAEESTAWPGVSKPPYTGGLGFNFKWNMGWMNDILEYFQKDPLYRKYHHNNLTFALMYAFFENFVLVLSHDEVVHGKRSLLEKMPGDDWQKFANLRLLLAYMYSQPGKKLLFMGGEFGQRNEWIHDRSLDWDLLRHEPHQALQRFCYDLNRLYRAEPAFWELDSSPEGFQWIDCHNWEQSVISFIRKGREDYLIMIFNFTPALYHDYRMGVPENRPYQRILNSDRKIYGGSGSPCPAEIRAEELSWQGFPASVTLTVPPLGGLILKPC
ncbi:MAG: 1,4-alpha-glucan branching protein GlgB [bacterium]